MSIVAKAPRMPTPPDTPQDYALKGHARGTSHAAGNASVEYSLSGHAAGTSHSAGKLTPETWLDWLPDVEPTLTINDVVDRVHQVYGVEDVTVGKVRFWQRKGVIPAPIRHKTTEGQKSVPSLYPEQAVTAIALIRALQQIGIPLRSINSLLAQGIPAWRSLPNPNQTGKEHASLPAGLSLAIAMINGLDKIVVTSIEPDAQSITRYRPMGELPASNAHDAALIDAVTIAASHESRRIGSPIRKIEISLDDSTAEVTFTDVRNRKHTRIVTVTSGEQEGL